MRLCIRFLLVFVSLTSPIIHAQPNADFTLSDEWLISELIEYADRDASIFSKFWQESNPIFLPSDLKSFERSHGPTHTDDLFFWKGQLCLAIKGTGRIYALFREGKKISAKRLDKTFFSGYNYGARVFSVRDTIFSLGGYGYWQYNGHLRFFHSADFGWEVKPIDKKIPATEPSTYFDRDHDQILFIGLYTFNVDEGIRNSMGQHPISELWKLSIADGVWTQMGTLDSTFAKKYLELRSLKVADSPFGEIFAFPNAGESPNGWVIDFHSNNIFTLKSVEKRNSIYSPFVSHKDIDPRNDRFISFYTKQDSTLHVLRSDRSHIRITLRRKDLVKVDGPVYRNKPDPVVRNSLFHTEHFWLISGLVFFLAGIAMMTRGYRISKVRSNSSKVQPEEGIIFTEPEMQVIRNFLKMSEADIGTDELDEWLGNTNKSIDLRNKYRSVFIRGINQKYLLMTLDQSGLIHAERLTSDRRMVRYRFDREKFAKLMAGSRRTEG